MIPKIASSLLTLSDAIRENRRKAPWLEGLERGASSAESFEKAGRMALQILPDKFVGVTAGLWAQALGPKTDDFDKSDLISFPVFSLSWDVIEAVPQAISAVAQAANGVRQLIAERTSDDR